MKKKQKNTSFIGDFQLPRLNAGGYDFCVFVAHLPRESEKVCCTSVSPPALQVPVQAHSPVEVPLRNGYPLFLFNVACWKAPPFIDDFLIKTSMYRGCSIAMFHCYV